METFRFKYSIKIIEFWLISGNPDNRDGIAWLFLQNQEFELFPDDIPQDWIMGLFPHQRNYLFENQTRFPAEIQPDISYTIVRRMYGPWGNRFSFEIVPQLDAQPIIPANKSSPDIPRSSRVINVPVGEPGNTVGYVELSSSTDFSVEALSFTRRASIMAASGAVLSAVILGLVMGKRFTNPITNLSDTTQMMSAGDLTVRASISGKDEISDLAVQFNTMADSLENSFSLLQDERDALHRFISDASHELRTPITAIKNFNDLLQNAAINDPLVQKEFLEESEKQIDQLTWITQNLLDLSRLDGGVASLDIHSYDVEDMIASAVSPFKAIASKKGIKLRSIFPAKPIKMECDRARFEIVVANLLENGIKFTPGSGSVEIGAERRGSTLAVWVQDTGIGISPEEQTLIFDRFYKGHNNKELNSEFGISQWLESILQAHSGESRLRALRQWCEIHKYLAIKRKIRMLHDIQHPDFNR